MRYQSLGVAVLLSVDASVPGAASDARATAPDPASGLFLTADATVRADDNIYLRSTGATGDMVLTVRPGLEYVFGQAGALQGHALVGEEFLRYARHAALDKSLAHAGLVSTWGDGKTKIDFSSAYHELAQNDVTVPGEIVGRKLASLRGGAEVSLTERTALAVGLTYDGIDYGPMTYTDNHEVSVPVDAYYEVSPKLDVSLGYRHRTVRFAGAVPDGRDHFVNLGARGEFTPKVGGQLRLGWAQRSIGGRRQATFGIDSDLTYAPSRKTTWRLRLANDFGASAFGQSTRDRSISVGVDSVIDAEWSWNAAVSQRAMSYPAGRGSALAATSDDFVEGTAGLSLAYNSHLTLTASYTRRNNASDLPAASFGNNVFSLGASVRY